MFVKPAAGLKIRDPDRRDFLPGEGREVPDTQPYWHRRLRDGDVELSRVPAPAPRKKPEANAVRVEEKS